jgi:hypothetical protein
MITTDATRFTRNNLHVAIKKKKKNQHGVDRSVGAFDRSGDCAIYRHHGAHTHCPIDRSNPIAIVTILSGCQAWTNCNQPLAL